MAAEVDECPHEPRVWEALPGPPVHGLGVVGAEHEYGELRCEATQGLELARGRVRVASGHGRASRDTKVAHQPILGAEKRL